METDALTAAFVLQRQHAGAKMMKAVLAVARECTEVQSLMAKAGRVRAKHTFGDGNELADKASRNQLELLRRQPQASGNRLQQVGLPLALVQHRPLELSRSEEPLPHLRPRLEVGLVVADVASLSLRHSFEVWCEITFWVALHSNKRLNHS